MKRTLLYPWHREAGARFAEFAGFEMPIQYPRGAVEEHRLCRRSVGLFDIDHMGQFLVSGKGAGEALSTVVSGPILDMRPGEARYSLLLNPEGGIIDDLFIYRVDIAGFSPEGRPGAGLGGQTTWNSPYPAGDGWFVVANAGNLTTDLIWLREHLPPAVLVADLSEAVCMIAVQGPRAAELLDLLSGDEESPGAGGSFSRINRAAMGKLSLGGIDLWAGRTGYTGEDGAELYYDARRARELWEMILAGAEQAGIEAGPVGLAARDSLRFEAGMPLHGHEISPSISPPEALLSWACDFGKDFIGKEALLAQKAAGLRRKLVTVNVAGGVPREGFPVLNDEGVEIGRCVAGMFCPTAGTFSANAFVPPEYAAAGRALKVLIRGNPKDAVVAKRPLYVPAYRRKAP